MSNNVDRLLNSYKGLQIIRDDVNMVDWHEDWTRVRSPGRAKRRMSKHKQNVRLYSTPKQNVLYTETLLIGHSETINQLMFLITKTGQENLRGLETNGFY